MSKMYLHLSILQSFWLKKYVKIRFSLYFQTKKRPTTDDILGKLVYVLRFHLFFIIYFSFGIMQERESNSKTYQLMLVSPIFYWLSHILFDFPLLVVHAVLSYIVLGSSSGLKKHYMIDNFG